MPTAPVCANEAERLHAVRNLEILDTPQSEVFDSFVRVARGLFDAPIAAIALIDADRQWFKAIDGLEIDETPRDFAFCAHAILRPGTVLCVPDARCDARFADNPLVTGEPGIRFYAGMPLVDEEGHALGSLSVMDTRPRMPDDAALIQLRNLATGVMAALRLHGALRRLADEARRDPLTGLGNRHAFDAALLALDRRAATLFMLDLDHFKAVNDAFGHSGGDAALREVAQRLRGVGRPMEHLFRFGGDAFAVLAEGRRDASAARARAAAMQRALAAPFLIDGQAVPLRTSIGIAGIPAQSASADDLVSAADAALHAAKRAGRGTIKLAPPPGGGDRTRGGEIGMGRITMQHALREALLTPRFEQFQVHFQPIVDLIHGRVTAHEALVRWTLPDGRKIGPADFVPVAEECGLVSHLDRLVLRQACAIAANWPVRWRVSVNISPVTIGLLDVVGLARDALDSSGLDPDNLVIEVTETAVVADSAGMVRTICGLRRLGAHPIVDDFGAGHASLAHLRRYPFNNIKTDRCFVAGLGTDARAVPVMETLVRLARSLELVLVAEGVETEEQLMILHRLGVTKVQGFFLARPVPVDQLVGAVERAEGKLARALRRHVSALPLEPQRADFRQPPWSIAAALREPAAA